MSENVDSYEGEVVPHEVYIRRRIVAVAVLVAALLLIIALISLLTGRGGDSKDTAVAASSSTSASAEAFSDFSQRATESASADSSDSADADATASADSSDEASAEATDDAQAEAEASARAAAEAEASASAEAAASAEATPEPTETTPAVAAACTAADLQVTLTADRASYGAGQLPALAVTYTNASGNPCVVTGGTANVDVNITSGPAQVYNYAQCNAVATADAEVAAGATNTTALTWNRQLNVLGCNTAATIQPGHYWATATVNGVSSQPVRIIVTG